MLHAYDSCLDEDCSAAVRALFDSPGLRRYLSIEIPLNTPLYHVDIAVSENDTQWKRLMFSRLENLCAYIREESPSNFMLTLQTRRDSYGNYDVKRVAKICYAINKCGVEKFYLQCADGSLETEDFSSPDTMEVLVRDCLWRDPYLSISLP